MTTAREIMTEDAECVREDQTVLEAAQKLTELVLWRSAVTMTGSRACSPTGTS